MMLWSEVKNIRYWFWSGKKDYYFQPTIGFLWLSKLIKKQTIRTLQLFLFTLSFINTYQAYETRKHILLILHGELGMADIPSTVLYTIPHTASILTNTVAIGKIALKSCMQDRTRKIQKSKVGGSFKSAPFSSFVTDTYESC